MKIVFTVFVLLFSFSLVAGDFQKGMDAYNKGDYNEAYKQWYPLAEKGDPASSYNIGLMVFNNANGNLETLKNALAWFEYAEKLGSEESKEIIIYIKNLLNNEDEVVQKSETKKNSNDLTGKSLYCEDRDMIIFIQFKTESKSLIHYNSRENYETDLKTEDGNTIYRHKYLYYEHN